MQLANSTPTPLEVLGPDGAPYLRVSSAGVLANPLEVTPLQAEVLGLFLRVPVGADVVVRGRDDQQTRGRWSGAAPSRGAA